MNIIEAIEMLELLKSSACHVSDNFEKSATVLDNVKLNSFTWVIDEAIKLLKKSPNTIKQLIEAKQRVMKIMMEETKQDHLKYQGGFVDGLDLAIKLIEKEYEK